MKKLLMTLMCIAAMTAAGTGLRAQQVTIPIMPGWNWISCPMMDTLDFGTAMGSFTPVEGDVIKTQGGAAFYRNGHWIGTISQFYPGYGYMYKSSRAMPAFVTFHAQQPTSQVVVTTSEPMLVTAISAMGGGTVASNDGTYIIVKGICWATHPIPTSNDSYLEEGSGEGSFSATMTDLNLSTTYYYRAYAVTPIGTVYGEQKSFTTRDGIPTVTTDDVTNILGTTATCGGNVTDNGGLNVTARGVCWSTSPNPTIADLHTINGNGTGSFTANITELNLSTTYYVRAYASTSQSTSYGEEVSFTTQSSSVGQFVDLGLPSGLLWATCDVGAEIPEEYGDYFAWGEIWSNGEYGEYNWSEYRYSCSGYEIGDGANILTKYCNNSYYGCNGFTDNLTILLPGDDVASALWGNDWRMPTKEEWQELYNNTTVTWTTQNGVNGTLFTTSNGNSLFLPSGGDYWSSSLNKDIPIYAYSSGNYGLGYGSRCAGRCVRPVRCKNSVINVTANPEENGQVNGGGTYMDHTSCTVSATANEGYIFHYWSEDGNVVSYEATYTFIVNGNRNLVANFIGTYVDLGLPSGTLWAACNVGANTSADYGDYFAWGETQPKNTYNWNNYQHCNGSYNTLTKYSFEFYDDWHCWCYTNYGYNGFTDNLTTLLPEDDAATVNWGGDWRMPTQAEWQELYQNTTRTWMMNGILFTASNGNSLFLPATGYRDDSSLYNAGSSGCYWVSSLTDYYPNFALNLYFDSYELDVWDNYRSTGLSVRAVRCKNRAINVSSNLMEGGQVNGGGTYLDHTSCTVSATANEGYIFHYWSEDGDVVSYEATYTFIVNGNRNLVANFISTYVDLGLPSGTLWATCNIGANIPEEYGDYFAWGETQPKDYYGWSTYQYSNGGFYDSWGDFYPYLTKYCNDSNYGYNGFTDNLTTLLTEDDAAIANWGNSWRMPTKEEWQELYQNTTHIWTTQNGVNGRLFTASNGNNLFLPAAGGRWDDELFNVGGYGYYWSRSLHSDPYIAWICHFGSGGNSIWNGGDYRSYGFSVRPVRSSQN